MDQSSNTAFARSEDFQGSTALAATVRPFDPGDLLGADIDQRGVVVTRIGGLLTGTPVMTLLGARPVEMLAAGMRVITRAGTRTVRAVAVDEVATAGMIRVSASVLGTDQPEDDLLLLPEQPVLVRDWRAEAIKGQKQAVIAVGQLVDGEYIRRETVTGQRLYRLEFDGPVVLYAGGLELASVED